MIHETAIIDPRAKLAENVSVGPWTTIGANVEIGEGTIIESHVVIKGPTRIGCDNHIFQFSSIGDMPQDKKYEGENSRLEIGDRNVIRESCTFNRGTSLGGGVTQIGDDNLFMAYVHVAHDCFIGNHTIFANNASAAGHVRIEDFVVLGGFSGVFQFCSMGAHSFSAMGSMIAKDVPPFLKVSGYYAKPYGLNTVGLKRRGFSAATLESLNKAYRILYRQGLLLDDAIIRLHELSNEHSSPELTRFINALENSQQGIIR